MNKQKIKQNALILAWGLYDLANQFFALNMVDIAPKDKIGLVSGFSRMLGYIC